MKIDKSQLIKTVLAINLLSLSTLFSVSLHLCLLQSIKVLIGIVILYVFNKISSETWYTFASLIYCVLIALLCFNLINLTGIKRWTSIFGIFVQFSEFSKIALVLMLAKFLCEKKLNLLNLCKAVFITFLPAILVFKQPNLGTALVITFTGLSMIWYKGIDKKTLVAILANALFAIPFLWQKMLPYQKARILAFLDPLNDPQGSSYQTIQSIIAIGAGGFLGSVALQNKLGFVPENHTDFLFSYFAEKNGFLLTILLISLILFGISKVLKLTTLIKDEFRKLFLFGFAVLWSIQSIINIAINLGLMPVTGIALPCFSYGGSSLVSFFIGLGIILNMLRLNK